MNKQLSRAAKMKRLERQLGVKATDRPDDVLAVLQIARRLLADGGELLKDGWQEKQSRGKPDKFSMDGALREALNLAHPHNRDESWWTALHALDSAIEANDKFRERASFKGLTFLLIFNNHSDTTLADAITVYDDAIRNQGRIKVAVSKAKGRK